AFFFCLFLLPADKSFSLAIGERSQSVWMRRVVPKLYTTRLAIRLGVPPKNNGSGRELKLIRARAAARKVRGRGPIDIQDAADKLAQGDAQLPPQPALQAGVVLCPAEKIAHQLAKYRA